MSFLKINRRFFLITFLVFSNFWIVKIFNTSLYIGVTLVLIAWLMALYTKKSLLILSLVILLFLQFKTTQPQSLTYLDNDQQRVQQERIISYPLTFVNLYFKVIWLKPVEWIEKNNLIIGLSRIEQNFFENLDLNRYFFGGYPRERVWLENFEMLPFMFLPFFILGLLVAAKSKKYELFILLIPLLLLAFIGNKNNLGPFSLFPFFIVMIFLGVEHVYKIASKKKLVLTLFILLSLLNFYMQIRYENF